MSADDLFTRMAPVPRFELTSTSVADGQPLAAAHYSAAFGVPGGEDLSPQLAWSGAPEGTLSYAVTVHDPDAPTESGFWHWAVANIPAGVHELAEGASAGTMPSGAIQIPNDARTARFIGAAPPVGHGPHRYVISVHAVDVASIELDPDATPAQLEFMMTGHVIGRATIIPTGERV